ncbi:hypothetical protein PILCRDRAFT_814788 [Piloderma croceum F 1598]|uniref:Ribonuclease H1 N-terminal domain-containing protein n=1 Tax=Piloderma croceum (strain F 1598) TaxID=765440 RepID=A0A0C3G672_PILCF|nr:hypothetical protein PILCRDRAFT_814788 [Piloderma croceum F 1598]
MIIKEPYNTEISPDNAIPPPYEGMLDRPFPSGPAYVVTVGSEVCIRKTWSEANLLINGVSGSTCECCDTLEKALAVLNHCRMANANDCNTPGQRTESLNSLSPSPQPDSPKQPIPPEELHCPSTKSKAYYAVTIGRKPGVYNNWQDAFKQTNGVAGCPKMHKTWQGAFNEYKAKYDAGETQVKTQK